MKKNRIPRNHVQFSKTFYGGKKSNEFSCIVDIEGMLPGSKAVFEGEYIEEKPIKFTRFEYVYKEGLDPKKIDLIVWMYKLLSILLLNILIYNNTFKHNNYLTNVTIWRIVRNNKLLWWVLFF